MESQSRWLRNPFRLKFDQHNRFFCSNHGIDVTFGKQNEMYITDFGIFKPAGKK
jgi:hypothetical protein